MKKIFIILCIIILANPAKSQIILTNDTSAFCNNFSYTLEAISATLTSITTDDSHSSVVPIGFTFNFYGIPYTSLVVSGNGYLSFDITQANGFSPYTINSPIPNPGSMPENAIMAPWEDKNPAIGGSITFGTIGVAPNRKFIVTWCQVPMFSCATQIHTSQVVLHEGSDKIEMFIQNKAVCAAWNGGAAVQGLVNNNSTNFDIVIDPIVLADRNFPLQWTATNEGWEFLPNNPASYTINQIPYVQIIAGLVNWYSDPALTNLLGTGPSLPININTTGVFTYYAEVTGGCSPVTLVDDVTIIFDVSCCDYAGDDNTINVCITDSPFNLFSILNNNPSPGGIWEDQLGNSISSTFDPANDPGGIYNYIIPATSTCLSDTAFVTVNLANISNLLVTPDTICSGNSQIPLTASISGGTFSGINITTSNNFNPITIGANTITYTVNGCSSDIDIHVISSPLASTQSITLPICAGDTTGSVSITVNGGTGIFDCIWNTNPPQTGVTAINLTQGTFNYTIIDENQCTFNDTVILIDPGAITPLLTAYNSSCYGANDGAVSIIMQGPTTPPGTVSDTLLAYCNSNPNERWGTNPQAIISEVQLIGDNFNINNNTAALDDSYENYTTTMYADITQGQAYSTNIKLDNLNTGVTSYDPEMINVYIDFNIDGDFSDPGEDLGVINIPLGTFIAGNTQTFNFTVPSTGIFGATRMRVVCMGNAGISFSMNACESPSSSTFDRPWYGATEDYSIVLNAPQISATYLWENGLTIDSITNLGPGTYSAEITSSDGCNFTDSVEVLEPEELFFNAIVSTILCNGTTGQISLSPSGGNNGPYIENWGLLNPLDIDAGIHTINIADSSTISHTNLVACYKDTIIIMNEPDSFSVDFTISSSEICLNDPITLNFNFIEGVAAYTVNYTINNGSSQIAGPFTSTGAHMYAVSPQAGDNIYSITSIIDSDGCPYQNDISSVYVDVNPLPDVNITVDPNSICEGDSAFLFINPTIGTLPIYVNYYANGTIQTRTILSPAGLAMLETPNITTVYQLDSIADLNGCKNYPGGSDTLIVNLIPEMNWSVPSEICDNSIVYLTFDFLTGNPPWDVKYNINGIEYNFPPTYNTLDSVSITPLDGSVYSIELLTDGNKCKKIINEDLTIISYPLPEIVLSGGGSICDDGSTADIIFTTTSGTPPYNLNYSAGLISNFAANIGNIYTFPTQQTGTYSIQDVTDAKGCQAIAISGSAYVNINPLPEAYITAYPQPANIINPKISFIDLSANHANGIWDFDDGNTTSTNFNKLTHTYSDTGTYQVSLSIESDSGCTDIAWQTIIISPAFTIYLPNAFTPNNDLNNDYFLPIVDGVLEYEFSVYDRLGERIFSTNAYSNNYSSCINDQNCFAAWDGKVNNGAKYATKGTYIYTLILTDIKGKERRYEGTFMLIR